MVWWVFVAALIGLLVAAEFALSGTVNGNMAGFVRGVRIGLVVLTVVAIGLLLLRAIPRKESPE